MPSVLLRCLLESSSGLLRRLGRHLGPLGSLLEASWGLLAASWRPLGGFVGPLGASCRPLGGLLAPLWASWRPLGLSLGPGALFVGDVFSEQMQALHEEQSSAVGETGTLEYRDQFVIGTVGID